MYADGEVSLEQCVVKLLQGRGATLALAEAGTGGHLAVGLSGADDAGRVLAGAYVAATEEKLSRLLQVPGDAWTQSTSSAERAKLLALAAADRIGSPWAVAVGQSQRDNRGDRYVEVVVKSPDGRLESRRVRLRGTGESARSRLTTQLLDQLRRRLR